MQEKNIQSNIESKIKFPCKWNSLGEKKFRIPNYQRKYAWQETEVQQLIKDLNESVEEGYFIGNIVVEEIAENEYDVIDGQQRLTTLYLMNLVVNAQNDFELIYEVRESDKKFLEELKSKGDIDENKVKECRKKYKPDNQLAANLNTIINEKNKVKDVFKKIHFAFTVLKPEEVDIAKYFEVMNSRGKQLEQHQVLKASFLECLDESDREIYGRLWDYCSRMDTYIEDFIYLYEKRQYSPKNKRNEFEIGKEKLRYQLLNYATKHADINIEGFFKQISPDNGTMTNVPDEDNRSKVSNGKISIYHALNEKDNDEKSKDGVNIYRSFIKFENFLLHILRLLKHEKEIIIKDTKLLEQFTNILPYLSSENKNADDAKKFLEELFSYRILFDYFFFKRFDEDDEPFIAFLDFNENAIFIDRYNKEKTIRQILNLQLLFNFTGDFYAQHWIQSVLRWLKENIQEKIDNDFYESYAKFLEDFDREIMHARLSSDGDLQQTYLKFSKPQDKSDSKKLYVDSIKDSLKKHLHKGTSTQHYWFYRLDYILWRDFDWKDNKLEYKFNTDEKFKYEDIPTIFRLSRLNSIEHIWPQSKKEDWSWNETCDDCPNEGSNRVDCFGNLALISQHLNSALSDESENKTEIIQKQLNRGTIDSLKMIIFYSGIKSSNDINLGYCEKHQQMMIGFLYEENSCPA